MAPKHSTLNGQRFIRYRGSYVVGNHVKQNIIKLAMLTMCALVRNTLLQSVRTAKATTPPTWSLASLEEHRCTVIYYLQFFQFFVHPSGGLTLVLIFMFVLMLLCFFFLPGRRDFLLADGERIACACSWCWYAKSEVYFGKDRATEERAAYPHHQEESSQRLSTV